MILPRRIEFVVLAGEDFGRRLLRHFGRFTPLAVGDTNLRLARRLRVARRVDFETR